MEQGSMWKKIRNMMTATVDTSTKSLYWKSLSQISQHEFKISWRTKIFLVHVFFFSKQRGRGNTYQAIKNKDVVCYSACDCTQTSKAGLCIGIGHLVRCRITRFESEVPATSPTLPGLNGNCGCMRWGMRGMWAVGKRFVMSENVTAIFLSFANRLEPLIGVIWI